MIYWYLARLKEHGFLTATPLFLRAAWARCAASFANKFLAARVECPCCGWEGRRFHDYIEVGCTALRAECPRCNSHARHRAFAVWLGREFGLSSKKGTALVFAPERALEPAWREAEGLRVLRTDIEPSRGVNLLADIQRLPLASDSFDLVWCQHVLMHIADDRAAIRELCRVLRPLTGELVVSVAQEPRAKTIEFGRAESTHLGFWRAYGDDFAERLSEGGLEVRPASQGLCEAERARYGIYSDERFFICTRRASS